MRYEGQHHTGIMDLYNKQRDIYRVRRSLAHFKESEGFLLLIYLDILKHFIEPLFE